MLSGAVLNAVIWFAFGLPNAAPAVHAAPVLENIYYAQIDGMT